MSRAERNGSGTASRFAVTVGRRVLVLAITGALVCAAAVVTTAFSESWTSAGAGAYPILAPRGPLRTAVFDGRAFSGPDAALAFERTRQAGARFARLSVDWSVVAPKTLPPHFDSSSPTAPQYDWSAVDGQVRGALAAGLQPVLDVGNAPTWASRGTGSRPQDGPVRPSARDFGDFATAIARRYSGRMPNLPRVRYWEVWNEPNVSLYLMPQYQSGEMMSADLYRGLVNAFYDAVHAVHGDNVVVAGGLSPFTVRNAAVDTVGPLAFMRRLLCLSTGPAPKATCHETVKFDVWSVHPYTSGGPLHHAYNPNDLSLGDLPAVPPLLRTAGRLGHLRSHGPVQYWITEFSWDTDPPDPKAVPVSLQARWVAEALYHAWRDGVSLFTWFTLRDEPASSDFQSGLYFLGKTMAADRPKPTLRAFAFPFVAYRQGGSVSIWGRTPTSSSGAVTIERPAGSGWARVAAAHANRYGIFQRTLQVAEGVRELRASYGSGTSLPFSLVPPKNENMTVTPFGVGSKK